MSVARRLSAALHERSALQLLATFAQRGARTSSLALQRHLLRRRFIEKRIHDYRLLLDADDPGIGRQLLSRAGREPEQKFIVESTLRPGMVAFDLGANVGYYTVMMAKLVGASGRVHAVEPFPQSFRLLAENVRRNGLGNVSIENIAIGLEDGKAQLQIARKSNWHSLHVPRPDPSISWQAKYARTIVGSIPVRTCSLRSYLANREPMDLLRMDLEGYEVEILTSLIDLPRAHIRRMKILFETHPEFYDSANGMRGTLEELCRVHGYRFEQLISDFQHGSPRDADVEPGREVFARRGYTSAHIVRNFANRAIYTNVRTEDAIELVCTSECVHAALMTPDDRA
ncbi:MAG TPA: FkbM family methyltransferase [Steroidobacter sp.]|uniref:FkbM family methyltransferase n=1 Tax=Steroidobacter sp. TaxID=1978227 RepID=UPI002ED77294